MFKSSNDKVAPEGGKSQEPFNDMEMGKEDAQFDEELAKEEEEEEKKRSPSPEIKFQSMFKSSKYKVAPEGGKSQEPLYDMEMGKEDAQFDEELAKEEEEEEWKSGSPSPFLERSSSNLSTSSNNSYTTSISSFERRKFRTMRKEVNFSNLSLPQDLEKRCKQEFWHKGYPAILLSIASVLLVGDVLVKAIEENQSIFFCGALVLVMLILLSFAITCSHLPSRDGSRW